LDDVASDEATRAGDPRAASGICLRSAQSITRFVKSP
jgi:hypothetical protein